MPDEAKTEEVKKGKPWYKKVKLMTGIGTILVDIITVLVSQLVTDPATSAIIMKMLIPVTAVGLSIITTHAATDIAYALKK